ncbi:hypothetical protein RclHR1_05400005 [Rhizophagus clarus]|uniref:Kinase-like domain-containing protein n=1 Tax=Rhizophagus clarus TaxID=94130 RepID=A0A2Z6RSX3_9GLOM|nr:hypothetical protein RclHR1_05400005 [Rhizophagus clarus]GES98186.1 kinase-like domain-containing protein [Rhizophagus clarus]
MHEQAIFTDTSSIPQFNTISMSSDVNVLDNMSQELTTAIASHTTPLSRIDENQSLQITCHNPNIQEMNSLQPIQDHLAPGSSSLAFFYAPPNDFQIYHITCEEISLSFESVSQLINHTDNSSSIHNYPRSNNIYVFYHEQPEIKGIYKVTCEMISHTFIFQFLNKIIYDNLFAQYEYYHQQEFSNSHQENLKFHLKKDLIHYLVPKQVHGQNYYSFYQDYYNYPNYTLNSNIDVDNHPQKHNKNITSQQDIILQNRSDYNIPNLL